MLTLYDIEQAGYYAYAERDIPFFGNIESILHDLKAWSSNKNIEETLSELVDEGEGVLPTLLASIEKHTDNNWLLILWNKVPEVDGKVLSIPRNALVGQAQLVANGVRADSIAGFPSYFWFLPEHNIVASVRINVRPTGPASMQAHIKSFMANHSSHVVKTAVNDDGEIKIIGYRCNEGDDVYRLHARFKVQVKRGATDIDIIREKVDQIYRFSRIEKFSMENRANFANWQRRIPGRPGDICRDLYIQNIKSEQTIKSTLNLEQLNSFIEEWEESEQHQVTEIDYKFYVHREPKPYRLGQAISRDKFELELEFDPETGMVDSRSLLSELSRQYANIVANFINV